MNIQMPPAVYKILKVLNFNGYNGHIVGGCVRDSILKKKPNDWDICTNCTPKKMLDILSCFTVIPTGLKHGTVTVVINGENYEITTYRIDGEYKDGRRPENVQFTNQLKEDLKRRDFTINAMAYNDKDGLIDYYGGIKDIHDKIIRCVGDPIKRFNEDYLRMLRGVRFSTQLEYNLDKETFNAINKLSKNIVDISVERIRVELNKILISHTPSKGLNLLNDINLLKHILPELKESVGFNQQNPNHNKDVFNHILDVVDNTENDLILRLSALFHDIGKPETFSLDTNGVGHFYKHHTKSAEITKKVMKRLKYDNESINKVTNLVKEHMSGYDELSDIGLKRLINRVGADNIYNLFKLQIADTKSIDTERDISSIINLRNRVERILKEKQPLSIKDLEINGHDLIENGITEGKEIGTILNELLQIILEKPKLNTKESLINIVKKIKLDI